MKYILTFTIFMMVSVASLAHNFSWDNLMLAHSKIDKAFDYELHVDSYMSKYRKPVWSKYRNDEFELEDKRIETIDIMRERIVSFDLSEPFTINTDFSFGEYDFKSKEFPVVSLSESHYFYVDSNRSGTFPYRYKIYFSNYNLVGNLPMSKEDAKSFLKSKKDRYGNVRRILPAKITFHVVDIGSGKGELKAKIKEVTIYKDNDSKIALVSY